MAIISVVIPAYNVELYIAEALESLIRQTMPDWECIVVNDGSTDRTSQILDRYSSIDPRIRHITIKNSGGGKFPRDLAISMATSNWIVALDADDFLSDNALELLLARQKETMADYVVLKGTTIDADGTINSDFILERDFDTQQVLTGKEAVMLTVGRWRFICNGALVSKNLLDGRTECGTHMNADEYDTRDLLIRAKYVAFCQGVYFYRLRPNSISSKISYKLFETLITDYLLIGLMAKHFGAGSQQQQYVKSLFINHLLGSYVNYANYRNDLSIPEREKTKQLIKDYRNKIGISDIIYSRSTNICKKTVLLMPSIITFSITSIISKLRCLKKLVHLEI